MRTTRTAGPAAAGRAAAGRAAVGTTAAGPDAADADPAGPAPVGSVAVRSAAAGQADRISAGRHRPIPEFGPSGRASTLRPRPPVSGSGPESGRLDLGRASRPGERAVHLVAAQRGPATRERLTLSRSPRPDRAWP